MQTNSYFQFSILLNNVEVEFRYISWSSVINYDGIIVIDPRWESTIWTMEYFAENTASSVLTLICSVGSEQPPNDGTRARNPLFRRSEIRFFNFL